MSDDDRAIRTPTEAVAAPSRKVLLSGVLWDGETVFGVDWANERQSSAWKEWSAIRSHDGGWIYCFNSSCVIQYMERANRLSRAGGPYLQQQALLRANASGAGDTQAELQEKGRTST